METLVDKEQPAGEMVEAVGEQNSTERDSNTAHSSLSGITDNEPLIADREEFARKWENYMKNVSFPIKVVWCPVCHTFEPLAGMEKDIKGDGEVRFINHAGIVAVGKIEPNDLKLLADKIEKLTVAMNKVALAVERNTRLS